jgi:hypothetical protein
MAAISERYGEQERINHRRVTASSAGMARRTGAGSHARQSSRNALASSRASIA